jgi:hypothetical protein
MWHKLSEVAMSWPATWHCGGAHLSVTCARVGPTCWHGPMGGCHVALGCWAGPIWCCHVAHTLSLPLFYISFVLCTQFVPRTIVIPKLHPELSWSNLNPWLIHLICFIFFEFILIAPLIQKSWKFHQKSLNSWWSSLQFLIILLPLPLWIKIFFVKKTLFLLLN